MELWCSLDLRHRHYFVQGPVISSTTSIVLGSHGMGLSDKETMGDVAMDEPLTTVLLHVPTCGLETTPCALQLTVVFPPTT